MSNRCAFSDRNGLAWQLCSPVCVHSLFMSSVASIYHTFCYRRNISLHLGLYSFTTKVGYLDCVRKTCISMYSSFYAITFGRRLINFVFTTLVCDLSSIFCYLISDDKVMLYKLLWTASGSSPA
jgi:hypothetical protein